jgi:hypothetical protein
VLSAVSCWGTTYFTQDLSKDLSESPTRTNPSAPVPSGKSMINRFTEFVHFEEPAVRAFALHP